MNRLQTDMFLNRSPRETKSVETESSRKHIVYYFESNGLIPIIIVIYS